MPTNYFESAKEARFTFTVEGLDKPMAVVEFDAREAVSTLFECSLVIACPVELTSAEVLNMEGLLTILPSSDQSAGGYIKRYFHGIVASIVASGGTKTQHLYQLTLVPEIWKLSLNRRYRIYQNMSAKEIIEKVLQENGIDSEKYVFCGMPKEPPPRIYCVQYGESDLRFVSRLLEEEGLYYFFVHSEGKHVLYFADCVSGYNPIPGNSALQFNSGGGMNSKEEFVNDIVLSDTILPDTFSQTDFNPERPSLENILTKYSGEQSTNTIAHHPGRYELPDRGEQLSRKRLEEIQSFQQQTMGRSNCPRLSPGHTFTLNKHALPSLNREYLLIGVRHMGTQPQVLEQYAGEKQGCMYLNELLAAPSSIQYRPLRKTPKPLVVGTQTAIVVGPSGEEIYPDKYCRVKVQFHWDQEGQRNERSSCWIRCIQPWGGLGWGAQFLPRVGDEVLVSFLDGDPDRPVIIGNAYNEANQSIYSLPANKTQSGIKTRSYPKGGPDNFNELRFEDKKGAEEVYLQGEKDWNILIKNNKTEKIGRNETVIVGVNKAETIGVAKELTIGAGYTITVGGAMNTAVGLAQFEEVGLNKTVLVGKSFDITVADSFSITCGASRFTMDKEGNVTISGSKFDFEASGHVQITGNDVDIN